jgi:pilus assembly protein FimV
MRRKLTAAIFTVSTLTSGLVHALGLGEVTVRSSLNQPLNAEIELLSVDELTEREIITALASREDFLRANVERTYFLSDLRFKVEMKPGGGAVIRVSSARPVKEPFLNFLVEVNWPTGRLLREYALLIDPPTFSKEVPAQVIPAASTNRVAVGTAATPAFAPAQAAGAAGGAVTGGQYGPTSRTDTLWSIALETRPSSDVSPQQMMLALQDANPGAFFDNNINRLKMGQVLRIPSREDVLRRSHSEAVVQVSAQNRAFAAGSSAAPRIDARPEGRDEAQVATRTPATAQDQLRIVADPEGAAGTGSGAVSGKTGVSGGGDAELVVTQERLDKAERDKADLQGRVGELEGQLETLQRLMSLKDEQLAALQARVSEPAPDTQAPVMVGKVDEGAASAVSPEAAPTAEVAPAR